MTWILIQDKESHSLKERIPILAFKGKIKGFNWFLQMLTSHLLPHRYFTDSEDEPVANSIVPSSIGKKAHRELFFQTSSEVICLCIGKALASDFNRTIALESVATFI